MLHLKWKVYQYTGIYLAQKEENAYIATPAAQDYIQRMSEFLLEDLEHATKERGLHLAEELARGLWQSEHHFVTDSNVLFLSLDYPRLEWLFRIYYAMKQDLAFLRSFIFG